MNNQSERIWKEADVAKFKVPFRNLLGGTMKNYEKFSHCIQSPVRDLNPGPPEHKAAVQWLHSVFRY
jgi:hypothetical protein